MGLSKSITATKEDRRIKKRCDEEKEEILSWNKEIVLAERE